MQYTAQLLRMRNLSSRPSQRYRQIPPSSPAHNQEVLDVLAERGLAVHPFTLIVPRLPRTVNIVLHFLAIGSGRVRPEHYGASGFGPAMWMCVSGRASTLSVFFWTWLSWLLARRLHVFRIDRLRRVFGGTFPIAAKTTPIRAKRFPSAPEHFPSAWPGWRSRRVIAVFVAGDVFRRRVGTLIE